MTTAVHDTPLDCIVAAIFGFVIGLLYGNCILYAATLEHGHGTRSDRKRCTDPTFRPACSGTMGRETPTPGS